jgi:hypothetical protein
MCVTYALATSTRSSGSCFNFSEERGQLGEWKGQQLVLDRVKVVRAGEEARSGYVRDLCPSNFHSIDVEVALHWVRKGVVG